LCFECAVSYFYKEVQESAAPVYIHHAADASGGRGGRDTVAADCPYCCKEDLKLMKVTQSDLARNYDDSPSVRALLAGAPVVGPAVSRSPVKAGDSFMDMKAKMLPLGAPDKLVGGTPVLSCHMHPRGNRVVSVVSTCCMCC
jgi:hypothetical protein